MTEQPKENPIAEAIREQTKFQKDVVKTIAHIILIVMAMIAVILVASIILSILYPDKGGVDTAPYDPNQAQLLNSPTTANKIGKYMMWCQVTGNIWVISPHGILPYCENIYGDKVHQINQTITVNSTYAKPESTNGVTDNQSYVRIP